MNKRWMSRYGIMAMGILLMLTGHFSSCEPEDWLGAVDCNECFGSRPDSAELIVYLTINGENDSVPLTLFEGDTDGRVDRQDTATVGEFYLDAAVGVNYTVRVEYRSGQHTVVAFDEDRMVLKDYGEECGDPCYIIKGGIFDVRLLE